MADALHHNAAFTKWCSEFAEDSCFGADFDFFQTPLEGDNVFVNPPFNNTGTQPDIMNRVIDRGIALCQSSKPTRVVMIVPVFGGTNGDRFLRRALSAPCSSAVAVFPRKNFTFDSPDDYRLRPLSRPFDHEVWVVLFCSKTSLLFDPVDWSRWRQNLQSWADSKKFQVRVPQHALDGTQPAGCKRALHVSTPLGNPYLSLMPWTEKHRIRSCKPILFSRANDEWLRDLQKGNWMLQAVGILPKMAQDTKQEDWGTSLLWRSFAIWELRSSLNYQFQKKQKQVQESCNSSYHCISLRKW